MYGHGYANQFTMMIISFWYDMTCQQNCHDSCSMIMLMFWTSVEYTDRLRVYGIMDGINKICMYPVQDQGVLLLLGVNLLPGYRSKVLWIQDRDEYLLLPDRTPWLSLKYGLIAEHQARERQVSILKSLVWLDRVSNPRVPDSNPRPSDSLISQNGRRALYSFDHPIWSALTVSTKSRVDKRFN